MDSTRRVVVLLGLLVLPLLAWSLPRVAVLDLSVQKSIDPTVAGPVTESIMEEIVGSKAYTVLDRAYVDQVLKEKEFQLSGLVSDSQVALVGQYLGADYILAGKIEVIGDTFFIVSKMIDVKTGVIVAQSSEPGEGKLSVLLNLAHTVGKKLMNGLTPSSSSPAPAAAQGTATTASAQTAPVVQPGSADLESLSGLGDAMILVKGGTFTMGGPSLPALSAMPQHKVAVSDFLLGSTEVDIGLLESVLSWAIDKGYVRIDVGVPVILPSGKPIFYQNPRPYKILGSGEIQMNGELDMPVTGITWYGAVAFCNLLSLYQGLVPAYDLSAWAWKRDANGFRLPTEGEWEYAARHGGKDITYPWGNASPMVDGQPTANIYDDTSYMLRKDEPYHPPKPFFSGYDDGSDGFTPVNRYPANELGFHDLGGNGQEWCWDVYGSYSPVSAKDPAGPRLGTLRVLRDCVPWNDWSGESLKVSFRLAYDPDDFSKSWDDVYVAGFRLARNAR